MSEDFLKELLESIQTDVRSIRATLDGTDGLIIQLDRLKESHRKQVKILWIIVTTLAPVILALIMKYVGW
jgi:hypothetical protein